MSYRRGGRYGNSGNSNSNNNGGMNYDTNSSSNNNNNNGGALTGHQLTQAAAQQQVANSVAIEVRGWQGATLSECVSFLSRKARIALLNATQENDAIVGYVRNKADADAIVKWSGVRFAGNPLRITSRSPTTSNTIEMLKRFLHRRYNPQLKLLDLSSIASDQELQQTGAFSSISTQSKMFPALMKLAESENFIVESVNLSDNNLDDLSPVTSLAQTYPALLNLSITNNRISKLRSLEIWKNKFRSLRELVLVNNPITADPKYKNDVSKVFPRLVILDGVVIRDENKLKGIYELPITRKHLFFEDSEIQQISTQFIANFLQCWDNDRTQLLPLYTPESQFSVSVDTSVPNDASAADVSFGYYIPISRNLSRVSTERARELRLGKGPEQIGNIFQQLPKTKHKLDTDPLSYTMEAWRYPQVNGIIISFHGEFNETGAPHIDANGPQRGHRRNGVTGSSSSKLTPKSFDRVFVIVPMPNSIIIASDLLIVRPVANNKAWQESIPASPSSQPGAIPPVPAPVTSLPGTAMSAGTSPAPGILPLLPDTLTPIQKEIATKLMMETKLNVRFTLLLAEQSGWVYENALSGFQQSQQQGQIPPEAFQ